MASIVNRNPRGFTLIELMTVIAVVGILVAIAIPSYEFALVKSRRGQAKADLVELAQTLERFYTVNNTYGPPLGTNVYTLPFDDSPRDRADDESGYTIALTTHTATTFTLTATPVHAQLTGDTKCGALTVDHTGQKGKSGTAAAVSDCW